MAILQPKAAGMSSPGNPAEARSLIIERLVGESGDASDVTGAARTVAERVLPLLQKSLAEEIGTAVTVDLSAVEVSRVADARARAGESFAMTVVASPSSPDTLTIVMDAQAIAVMVCLLFGGDADMPAAPIDRELSSIETEVATLLFQQIAEAFNGSGARGLDLRLPVPAAMSGPEAQRRVLRDGPAARIVFSLSTPADSGTIAVTVPQRVLLAERGNVSGAEASTSSTWRQRFSEEVMRSAVTLEATMPLATLTLGQLAGLEAGQVIEIEETARSQARLSSRNKTLFVCEFGKLGQNYTVRIKHPFDAGQDFIDGLVPH